LQTYYPATTFIYRQFISPHQLRSRFPVEDSDHLGCDAVS